METDTNSAAPDLAVKQRQFNAAMEKFNSGLAYSRFGLFISVVNCVLQAAALLLVFRVSIGVTGQAIALFCAYLFADFINGLVHIYMDNNGDYTSSAGPLVAAFHLHHKKPLYQKRNVFLVYFYETGSKVWLTGYLLLTIMLVRFIHIHPLAAYLLVYTGVLSSVAEVSHYLCHVQNSRIPEVFRALKILLNKRHHGKHHLNDNTNYAFLNGITDPLLNIIARWVAPGYKSTTDLHYREYTGPQTENR